MRDVGICGTQRDVAFKPFPSGLKGLCRRGGRTIVRVGGGCKTPRNSTFQVQHNWHTCELTEWWQPAQGQQWEGKRTWPLIPHQETFSDNYLQRKLLFSPMGSHWLCIPSSKALPMRSTRNSKSAKRWAKHFFFLLILCLLFFNLTGYPFVYIFWFSVLIQMGLLLWVFFVFLPFTLYVIFYFS